MLPARFLRWCIGLLVDKLRKLKDLGLRGTLRFLLGLLRQLLFAIMLVAFILLSFTCLIGALVVTWNVGPAEMLDLPFISFMNGAATILFTLTAIITWRFIIWLLGKSSSDTLGED